MGKPGTTQKAGKNPLILKTCVFKKPAEWNGLVAYVGNGSSYCSKFWRAQSIADKGRVSSIIIMKVIYILLMLGGCTIHH